MTRPPLRPLLALLLPLAACATDVTTATAQAPRPQAATAALTAATAPDLRQSVRQATSRDAANLKAVPGTGVVQVEAGFQQVTVARAHPDGTVSTRCVGTPQEAEAYLDGPQPTPAPARATE